MLIDLKCKSCYSRVMNFPYKWEHFKLMQNQCREKSRLVAYLRLYSSYRDACHHIYCRDSTLPALAATLLNKLCISSRTSSRTSQHVSTDIPIHRPSWPPMSAIKLTSYKRAHTHKHEVIIIIIIIIVILLLLLLFIAACGEGRRWSLVFGSLYLVLDFGIHSLSALLYGRLFIPFCLPLYSCVSALASN